MSAYGPSGWRDGLAFSVEICLAPCSALIYAGRVTSNERLAGAGKSA